MNALSNSLRVIGVMSPGDMGHAIGRVLRARGFDVITCLEDRSQRTRNLADKAGFRSVSTWSELVDDADVLLSILVPKQALAAAETIATATKESGKTTHFVDCNAVSVETIKQIEKRIRAAGIQQFSDGSIIGLPPGSQGDPTRLYVSGPSCDALGALEGSGIEVRSLGPEIGRASAIKMCYAGITKATFALYYASAIAAQRYELLDELLVELESSQPAVFAKMNQHLPRLPVKAGRWVGEMEEIAAAFRQAGVTGGFHDTAAVIFHAISQSSFAGETPETIDVHRKLAETIEGLETIVTNE